LLSVFSVLVIFIAFIVPAGAVIVHLGKAEKLFKIIFIMMDSIGTVITYKRLQGFYSKKVTPQPFYELRYN